MTLQLLVGTLDLTKYLDVQQGNGLDPADAAFAQQVISHSLLGEGGTFAMESANPKELAFPVKLNAPTKDGLHVLVQQVNLALKVANQTLTWQDAGATTSTTFDVIAGQFDPEFDYRRGEVNYLNGKLRVFVAPFGRTPGPRLVGTAIGSFGPVTYLPAVPSIAGDAGAQIGATIAAGALIPAQGAGRITGLAVLPSPAWKVEYRPSDLWFRATVHLGGSPYAVTVPTIQGGSGAAGSIFWRKLAPATSLEPCLALGATLPLYAEPVRLLALMRANNPTAALGVLQTSYGLSRNVNTGNGPLPVFGTDWSVYDFGTLQVPNIPGASYFSLQLSFELFGAGSIDFNELLVLPEARTTYIRDTSSASMIIDPAPAMAPYDNYLIDERNSSPYRVPSGAQQFVSVGGNQVGLVPRLFPTQQVVAFSMLTGGGAMNDAPHAAVSIIERVRYLF